LSGLSLSRVSSALTPLVRRCRTAIWLWVKELGGAMEGLFIYQAVEAFVDEGLVWVHSEPWWLWVAYDILRRHLMFRGHSYKVLPKFLRGLRSEDGVKTVYTIGRGSSRL
jgi:hypothetical protein